VTGLDKIAMRYVKFFEGSRGKEKWSREKAKEQESLWFQGGQNVVLEKAKGGAIQQERRQT